MAMSKGEKNAEVLGKGCSLFCRLAKEVEGLNCLKSDFIFKRLAEFEDKQKRLKRQSSMTLVQKRENFNKTTSATNLKKNTKILTTKHGCQLTENIVRYHSDPLTAINGLMKQLRK